MTTTTVWILTDHGFDWNKIVGVYQTKDAARNEWNRMLAEKIQDQIEVINMCKQEGTPHEFFVDGLTALMSLKPGEKCTADSYPYLEEWVVQG